MPANVIRFGGNNINHTEKIQSFISILKNIRENHIIVVSASENIQQILYSGLELLRSSLKNNTEVIDQLKHEALLIATKNGLKQFRSFSELLTPLERLLKGIHFTGDYSLALRDQVLSYSEKLTTALLQDILQNNHLAVKLIFPDEIGLIVSEEYGNASILIQESAETVKKQPWGKINLIPGSFGKTQTSKIARVGDRAADYTAAALASILNAEKLELWEISKTFKTADDTIVPNASYIESLTYSEASELAYFNHSSIHPRIVEPLIEQHIPIQVYELQGDKKVLKTTINSSTNGKTQSLKSVAHSDEIAILKLNGPGVGFKPGILATVTTAFAKHLINIRSVITAQTSINIIIDKSAVSIAEKISQELDLPSVNQVEIVSNISLIAIVGHGMQQKHGSSALLFGAVSKHKINVLLSGSGASDLVSYLIVDEKDKQKAIQEIHKIFFNN